MKYGHCACLKYEITDEELIKAIPGVFKTLLETMVENLKNDGMVMDPETVKIYVKRPWAPVLEDDEGNEIPQAVTVGVTADAKPKHVEFRRYTKLPEVEEQKDD